MPRINGVKGAYLQPPRYGRNESGSYTIYPYEGTKTELLALVGSIEGLGGTWEMEESFSGAKCRLTARFATNVASGGAEVPVSQWEFFAGRVEKDVLETDLATVQAITDTEKRKIRDSIANPLPDQDPIWLATASNAAIDVYRLMLKGVRSVLQFAPTLKHTQMVSQNWTVKASLTNVGRVISTASISTLESIPAAVLFNLPNNVWNGVPGPGLAYGWLKFHPTIRVAAYQKIQIEQEWVYNLWSTLLYQLPL